MTLTNTGFAHQRLDAYRIAFRLFEGVEQAAQDMPKGYADLKDQVRRAAASTVRNIAEGANRYHAKDRAARFSLARCECAECDASLEMAMALEVVSNRRAVELRAFANRVGAMLTGLINRERGRSAAG